MSILIFSGMRKSILSFVFRTVANIVFADSFFSVLIMLSWFPYGDIWADVDLSSLWMFCKT